MSPRTATTLYLPPSLQSDLEVHTRAEFPREACGTLIGRTTELGVEVVRVERGENLNESSEQFTLDPAHLVRAEQMACDDGLEIVGIWHSHPNQPAVPSTRDREAAWRGWSYLILSVLEAGVSELRSWRIDGDVVREERVVTHHP